MATVKLDIGNWLYLEKGDVHQFGVITGIKKDDQNPNVTWVLVNGRFDMVNNKPINFDYSFSNSSLAEAERLLVFDPEHGERKYHGIMERYAREHETPEASISLQEVPGELVGPTGPIEPIEPSSGSRLSVPAEEVEREPTEERYRPIEDYSRIRVILNEGPIIESKDFKFTLNTGEYKTLMEIARKNLSEVFPLIDAAVENIGHQFLEYIDKELIEKIIDYKIAAVLSTEKNKLESGMLYRFKRNGENALLTYIKNNIWYAEKSSISSMPEKMLLEIPEDTLPMFYIEEVQDRKLAEAKKQELQEQYGDIFNVPSDQLIETSLV